MKLTSAQQKIWDAGFVRALRLVARGPKNRRFWNDHEKKLAKKALKVKR